MNKLAAGKHTAENLFFGFEPMTYGLLDRRSINWATGALKRNNFFWRTSKLYWIFLLFPQLLPKKSKWFQISDCESTEPGFSFEIVIHAFIPFLPWGSPMSPSRRAKRNAGFCWKYNGEVYCIWARMIQMAHAGEQILAKIIIATCT